MRRLLVLPTVLVNMGLALYAPARADVVLLDEYWVPEIVVNDVQVTEADTQQTGDATQARFGEFSALLSNETGWPNVRFIAARLALEEIPPEESDVCLWYRTNAWAGKWRLEIWMFYHGAVTEPVKVLEANLDGGEDDGRLTADGDWHEARGILRKAQDYDKIPTDAWGVSYVWLVPGDGWGIPHETYVDRIEVDVLAGPFADVGPDAPVRVRPRPGAQTTGDTWVWWEAEDAIEHSFPPSGAYPTSKGAEQAKLSNGAWLQHHNLGELRLTARWEIDVPQAGDYHLWCRGCMTPTPFRWRWDAGHWQERTDDVPVIDRVMLRDWMGAWWFQVDDVTLTGGKHTFEIEGKEGAEGAAFDCFLLTQREFTPEGAKKPGRG